MNISNKDDKKRKKEITLGKIISKIINPTNKQNNNIGINVSKKIDNEQVKIILTFD